MHSRCLSGVEAGWRWSKYRDASNSSAWAVWDDHREGWKRACAGGEDGGGSGTRAGGKMQAIRPRERPRGRGVVLWWGSREQARASVCGSQYQILCLTNEGEIGKAGSGPRSSCARLTVWSSVRPVAGGDGWGELEIPVAEHVALCFLYALGWM
ncbi:unnamed protein product [Pleuronectes platessa]|uniref:Uncharacterized protein n=1 Tax=Pleuronectes platessa TaxID=8262 RepID=A0A9N7UE90_PLEPL|nr:unnamed protein product [Pleuronectes platessa]